MCVNAVLKRVFGRSFLRLVKNSQKGGGFGLSTRDACMSIIYTAILDKYILQLTKYLS